MANLPNKKLYATKTTNEVQSSALALCIAVNSTVIIWGMPGAGKTSVLNAIARANNLHMEQVLLSTKEPADVAGLPFIDIKTGVARQAPPEYADVVTEEFKSNKRSSIIFWDELSTAVPATQAAALTTILDKKAGRLQMPVSTRMVAAANPPKIAANGWDLSAPMANRFTHLDWDLSAKDIARGMQMGWQPPVIPRLPKNMKALIRNAEIIVGSFIESRPTEAVKFDADSFLGNVSSSDFRAANNAYPTARSWTSAARLFAAAQAAVTPDGKKLHKDVSKILLEGTVGVAMATEFLQYADALNLPSPIEVLRNPDGFELPQRGDKIAAILASVQNEALSRATAESYPAVWRAWGDFLCRVVDAGKGDVALMFAKEWKKAKPPTEGLSDRHAKSLNALFEVFEGV